ncbi:MAG: ATP-binding protein [Candidatus Omnitrophica bacterium]|nr:ATP-binding protein [Candidatus Omnitrophota bacterium]
MTNGGILAVKIFLIEKYIEIQISDTGSGIDKKDLPHIFEPFFSKKEKGTGLGLSVTQSIIDDHGGKIRVSSEMGKGTTFKIMLPFRETI